MHVFIECHKTLRIECLTCGFYILFSQAEEAYFCNLYMRENIRSYLYVHTYTGALAALSGLTQIPEPRSLLNSKPGLRTVQVHMHVALHEDAMPSVCMLLYSSVQARLFDDIVVHCKRDFSMT
jgi:hypothetical protein